MGVSIDGFSDAVKSELDKINVKIPNGLDSAARKAANDARKSLVATSPVGNGRRHYASGWTVTSEKSDGLTCEYTVHNKTKPGLAHLLEHGHGGPHPGPAITHIAPVEQQAIKEFEDNVIKNIEKGL